MSGLRKGPFYGARKSFFRSPSFLLQHDRLQRRVVLLGLGWRQFAGHSDKHLTVDVVVLVGERLSDGLDVVGALPCPGGVWVDLDAASSLEGVVVGTGVRG